MLACLGSRQHPAGRSGLLHGPSLHTLKSAVRSGCRQHGGVFQNYPARGGAGSSRYEPTSPSCSGIHPFDPTSSPAYSSDIVGILARSKPDDPRRGGPDEGEGVDSAPDAGQPSAVRFNSAVQEIEPRESLVAMTTSTTEAEQASQPVDAETQQALRMVSQSLQRQRTNNFAFEPVSLPASRVCMAASCSFSSLLSMRWHKPWGTLNQPDCRCLLTADISRGWFRPRSLPCDDPAQGWVHLDQDARFAQPASSLLPFVLSYLRQCDSDACWN